MNLDLVTEPKNFRMEFSVEDCKALDLRKENDVLCFEVFKVHFFEQKFDHDRFRTYWEKKSFPTIEPPKGHSCSRIFVKPAKDVMGSNFCQKQQTLEKMIQQGFRVFIDG